MFTRTNHLRMDRITRVPGYCALAEIRTLPAEHHTAKRESTYAYLTREECRQLHDKLGGILDDTADSDGDA